MVTPVQIHDTVKLKIKWLKFWNYFSLPVGGIFGILMSVGFLKSIELMLLGIIVISMSILQLIVAYGLHHRKFWAWQWNWVLVAIVYMSLLIPIQTSGYYEDTAEFVAQSIMRMIVGSLVWVWPNYVYWKKRKGLFLV